LGERKLLILNGEMLERSIRHAWKAKRASNTEPLRSAPTYTRSAVGRRKRSPSSHHGRTRRQARSPSRGTQVAGVLAHSADGWRCPARLHEPSTSASPWFQTAHTLREDSFDPEPIPSHADQATRTCDRHASASGRPSLARAMGYRAWATRIAQPRPASNRSRSLPASTNVQGPIRSALGVGDPVPRRVTVTLAELCGVCAAAEEARTLTRPRNAHALTRITSNLPLMPRGL
jgi:hypothetical protein